MDRYQESLWRAKWTLGVIVVISGAVGAFITAVAMPSGPSTGPSIRTEEIIFEDCLEKSRDSGPYQAEVVNQCRRAAAQMVGRLARTQ